MKYAELEQIIIDLPFDEEKEIYSNNVQTLYVVRPKILSERFKEYDASKNIQIWLKIGDKKPFKPNHFRLLIDLYTRVREYPESKNTLLEVFDRIFYGEDPLEVMHMLDTYHFTQAINPIDIAVVLAQLFIAEQNVGFGKKSKYNPRSLYIQGWIRTFINADYEIDQVISGISFNRPPLVGYTKQDDKNHKEYNSNAQPLWYK
ncbi:MAG: hypothetical protein ACTTH0_04690 [Eubacteriales bacterium]